MSITIEVDRAYTVKTGEAYAVVAIDGEEVTLLPVMSDRSRTMPLQAFEDMVAQEYVRGEPPEAGVAVDIL